MFIKFTYVWVKLKFLPRPSWFHRDASVFKCIVFKVLNLHATAAVRIVVKRSSAVRKAVTRNRRPFPREKSAVPSASPRTRRGTSEKRSGRSNWAVLEQHLRRALSNTRTHTHLKCLWVQTWWNKTLVFHSVHPVYSSLRLGCSEKYKYTRGCSGC